MSIYKKLLLLILFLILIFFFYINSVAILIIAVTVKIISKTWFVLFKGDLDSFGMFSFLVILLTLLIESGLINDL